MMGLGKMPGFSITPTVTGSVLAIIAGTVQNLTTLNTLCNVTGKQSTGVAPANGAAATGTTFGIVQQVSLSITTAGDGATFVVMAVITGLALNTAVWFDVDIFTGTASTTIQVHDVQCILVEV